MDKENELKLKLAECEAIIIFFRDALDKVRGLALTKELSRLSVELDWFPNGTQFLTEHIKKLEEEKREKQTILHTELDELPLNSIVQGTSTGNIWELRIKENEKNVWLKMGSNKKYDTIFLQKEDNVFMNLTIGEK